MNFRRIRLLLLSLTFTLLLIAPRMLYPCGPFFYSPVFVSTLQPEDVGRYVGGHLGVPLRSYRGVYAFVAYRYFSGSPLNANEQKLLTQPPPGISTWWSAETGDEAKPWVQARAAVPGVPPSPQIEMFKSVGNYQSIVNCTPDAFRTAARTLLDRIAKYGPSSPDVKEWVAGQDRVFVQCSANAPGVAPLPDAAVASAPGWLKKDRAYQLAAANFYAGNFDDAHAQFLTIAADESSSWQPWGRYLAGRSLIRKATLKPERADQPYDPQVLTQAEAELKQVVADPKLGAVHEAATHVLGYVEFRLHPQQRETELAKLISTGKDPNLRQDVMDFLLLVKDNDDPDDDLSQWMSAFRSLAAADPDAERAPSASKVSPIAEWKAKKTLPWLVLAISAVKPADQGKRELLAAARKVASDSPAYPTLLYHEARLADAAESRKLIDDFLAKQGKQLPLSSRNLFLRERLDRASDFDDFLAHAERQPAATAAEGYGDEYQEFCGDQPDSVHKDDCARSYLDPQAAAVMDLLPLGEWLKAGNDKHFGAELRQQLLLTAWCRAVMMEDWDAAKRAASMLKETMPSLARYLDPFLRAKDNGDRKFAAAFAMLHWPGIKPSLADDTLRSEPLTELNDFRMNWWCSRDQQGTAGSYTTEPKPVQEEISPEKLAASLMNSAQQSAAAKERAKIDSFKNGPFYLEPVVLSWAKSHPNDDRVPEALHLAVTAGHLSCSNDDTAGYSKEAFTILHNRYPNSEWAKKTKYWYK